PGGAVDHRRAAEPALRGLELAAAPPDQRDLALGERAAGEAGGAQVFEEAGGVHREEREVLLTINRIDPYGDRR
ncbi:MAG: hypothetical protein ACK56I_29720, partial [bacterium]